MAKRTLGTGTDSIEYADGWDDSMSDSEFEGLVEDLGETVETAPGRALNLVED